MLTEQITMIDYAKSILHEMKKGVTLKDILTKEQDPQILTRQIMMEVYFKMFEITIII